MNLLLQQLKNHKTNFSEEKEMVEQTLAFIEKHPTSHQPNCFQRELSEGHITASAWITDESISHALFTHHAKIGKWLQLGGHCDGNTNAKEVALTEAREESGLSEFQSKQPNLFDVDIHTIPAHKTNLAHLHYDIRFWFVADINMPLIVSNESKDLKWLPINEIEQYNNETSIMRMVKKCKALR